MEWDTFKNCCRIQKNLDLEAWDVLLFQPLKDLHAWWIRQSDTTKLFTGWLTVHGQRALPRWIAKVAKIADAEAGGLLADALLAVTAGLAFGTFMDVVGRCLGQQVSV